MGNYLSRCSLEIDEWIILSFIFMSVMDTLVQQIRLIDLVLKPNALHPRTVQGELLCLFPKIITHNVDYLFETLNLLAPFPCHLFLCFFSPRLGENAASAHFQGNPTKCTWQFFFWLGGTENNTIFSYFRNFRIFSPKRLIFPDGGSICFQVSMCTFSVEYVHAFR